VVTQTSLRIARSQPAQWACRSLPENKGTAGARCGRRRLAARRRSRRGCWLAGGWNLAGFQARERSVLTRNTWGALASSVTLKVKPMISVVSRRSASGGRRCGGHRHASSAARAHVPDVRAGDGTGGDDSGGGRSVREHGHGWMRSPKPAVGSPAQAAQARRVRSVAKPSKEARATEAAARRVRATATVEPTAGAGASANRGARCRCGCDATAAAPTAAAEASVYSAALGAAWGAREAEGAQAEALENPR